MTGSVRLGIGTAQFGLDYGITNRRGAVPVDEVGCILTRAEQFGVRILDTARAYGRAEKVLGRFSASYRFSVVTKVKSFTEDGIFWELNRSIKDLRSESLYAVLLHSATSGDSFAGAWLALTKARQAGLVRRVGVSLYYPSEWRVIEDRCATNDLQLPEVVQIPMSVFDQRFVPLLSDLHRAKTEVHVRSVFLQGAAFLSPDQLPEQLKPLGTSIKTLGELSADVDVEPAVSLLAFPLLFDQVGSIVVGVDSFSRLEETLRCYEIAENLRSAVTPSDFAGCVVADERIVVPTNWVS